MSCVCEDNDSEDMHISEEDCRLCIDLYRQLEDGEINEWEIGGDEQIITNGSVSSSTTY